MQYTQIYSMYRKSMLQYDSSMMMVCEEAERSVGRAKILIIINCLLLSGLILSLIITMKITDKTPPPRLTSGYYIVFVFIDILTDDTYHYV